MRVDGGGGAGRAWLRNRVSRERGNNFATILQNVLSEALFFSILCDGNVHVKVWGVLRDRMRKREGSSQKSSDKWDCVNAGLVHWDSLIPRGVNTLSTH